MSVNTLKWIPIQWTIIVLKMAKRAPGGSLPCWLAVYLISSPGPGGYGPIRRKSDGRKLYLRPGQHYSKAQAKRMFALPKVMRTLSVKCLTNTVMNVDQVKKIKYDEICSKIEAIANEPVRTGEDDD